MKGLFIGRNKGCGAVALIMKRMIAKGMVFLMLLTSAVLPSGVEKSAGAATKMPELKVNGGITGLNILKEDGMAQEVGKTITLTITGVKKGNIKDITCYIADPRVATVTGKTVTKKKSGFKVNIKKLGRTYLSTRITLKKKQNGLKMLWRDAYVTGVKKMSKKELEAFPGKYVKVNTRSVLLDKHGSYSIAVKMYDENGNLVRTTDIFHTKEDHYVRDAYPDTKEVNHIYTNTSNNTNTGYGLYTQDGTVSDFYFCRPEQDEFMQMPLSDDTERVQAMLDSTDPEYGYYDGTRYYYSDVSNSKDKEWSRTESILDGKTYEFIYAEFYNINEDGKAYLVQTQKVEKGVEALDMYNPMKYLFAADGKKKIKLECVIDPGTPEERRVSKDIPEGAAVRFSPMDGYGIFMDAEGKTPLSADRDTSHDLTVYYIKQAE